MASLSLKHIFKVYDGNVKAVNDFCMDIEDNEFIVFVGPSGCGKTTTLRIIAGFLEPTSGDVLFEGKRINGMPPHKRNVNTVFQRYALFPHLNVFENVALKKEKTILKQLKQNPSDDPCQQRTTEADAGVRSKKIDQRKNGNGNNQRRKICRKRKYTGKCRTQIRSGFCQFVEHAPQRHTGSSHDDQHQRSQQYQRQIITEAAENIFARRQSPHIVECSLNV